MAYPKIVTISRDGFARFDRVRMKVRGTEKSECTWCGRKRKGGLFQYGTWWDAKGKPEWLGKLFCSIGCFRDYTS